MEKIPTLYIMCGLPASGKSTLAKIIAGETKGVIVSSDNIREKYDMAPNETVKTFELVYKDINKYLSNGYNVIFDATNVTIKARKNIFSNVKERCKKVCYIVNTPYDICLQRDKYRFSTGGRRVGIEVINKFYKSFQIPFLEEGFDNIVFVDKKEFEFNKYFDRMTDELKEHCAVASKEYIAENFENINQSLAKALLLHDYGKIFTKTYDENNEAHYYSHDSIGAYELICEGLSDLDILFYINYHMMPFYWKQEKTKTKYKEFFGKEKFENLLVLNHFDQYAH